MINTANGYILSVTDDSMSDELMAALNNTPTLSAGCGCRLKADTLEWEIYELPYIDELYIYSQNELLAMTNAQLQEILANMGISGSMTKQNMVALILQKQSDSIA